MNDKIKEKLGEELAKQVSEKLGDLELAVFNDGSVVPVEKFDSMKSEYKSLQERYELSSKEIANLTNATGELTELQEQLKTLSTEHETFKADAVKREANYKKGGALKELLRKNFNPDAVDLLANTINLDEITLNDAGKIVDGDSKMQRLAETKPSLKLSQVIEGTKPLDRETIVEVDTSKMTDDEYFASQNKGD